MTWTEGSGNSAVTYEGKQVFVYLVNYFFGKKGAEPIEVSAGVHLYKFSDRIPKDAAGSAEGTFGYIRYKVAVTLDIPYLPDMYSEQPFIVVRQEDLNRYPELKIASEVEEARTFHCFVCESNPVMVRLWTAKSGFVLGEKIPVKVEIFNRSNIRFPKSLISLNRVESSISLTPIQKTKKHITPLTAIFAKGVEPGKNAKFEEILNIPNNAFVSNDRICDVFQVTYEIRFFMKAAKRSSSLEVNLPIFIGHVGFRLDSSVSLDSSSLPIDDYREIRKCKLTWINKFFSAPFCKKVATSQVRIPQRFEFIL